MLFVLQGARLLVNGTSAEWHLSPGEFRAQPVADRRPGHGVTLGGWLAKFLAAVQRAQQDRQVIRDLSALDDRLLADMGIARHEIRALAKGEITLGSEQSARPVSPTAQVRYDVGAAQEIANDPETRSVA